MYSKKDLLSTAMKRTSEWIFSQEIPSDVTIKTGGVSLPLHKYPLLSKCGLIQKLVSESSEADLSEIDLPEVPGGAEALELAAKFCYGINFEISTDNIATLRCVAEYLEMTEEYAVGNLVGRAEAYLGEVALNNLPGAISVLHKAETLLPTAEKVKLVSRCVDAIAFIACKESQFSTPHSDVVSAPHSVPKTIVEWWAEDLTVLRIDFFQRVLVAMMARGFKQYAIGPILMLYAQKSLRGLDVFGKGRKKIEVEVEHEKRVVLETVVSLLPREKNAMSVSFLSMLLRAAIYLETTVACRLDLEKRMGTQLGQAVLDDLLIPSYSFTGDTLFDVDTVQRIMTNFIDDHAMEGRRFGGGTDSQTDMEHVGKLMENYLTEIASDRNLSIARFISLAELVPEQAKVTEDGMYRAIDIYLKAHPVLSDMERKKVCSLMDCQKLSREACAHAAQNDRLPVQTVVQVLYYEQQRIREVMDGSLSLNTESSPHIISPLKSNPVRTADTNPELTALKRENADLKIEVVKLKMKLREMERLSAANNSKSTSAVSSPDQNTTTKSFAEKPPLPRKSFINSVSKKLGRLSPFGVLPSGAKARTKAPKDRRHSIS